MFMTIIAKRTIMWAEDRPSPEAFGFKPGCGELTERVTLEEGPGKGELVM